MKNVSSDIAARQRLSSARYLMMDLIALLVFLIKITIHKPLTYDLDAVFLLIRMYGR
jgi:hypothetical protein